MDTSPCAPSTWRSRQPLNSTQPAREHSQTWTASRCRRLLRPLFSHVAALKKQVRREQAEAAVECGSAGDSGPDNVAIALDPNAPRNKVRHTYSRRRKNPRQPSESSAKDTRPTELSSTMYQHSRRRTVLPGEIVLPTPVLKRARGHQILSPVPQPALGQNDNTRPRKRQKLVRGDYPIYVRANLEDELMALRMSIPACQYPVYESLFRSFEALLRATSDMSQVSKPKSLLTMCLRKVPHYIDELEFWEQKDAEEHGNKSILQHSEIPDQIYGELESLGSADCGWKHLRTAVRAHGVKVITDAISDGLLDSAFPRLLVMLCCRSQCYIEGEDIIRIMVDRQYPKPKTTNSTFDDTRRLSPLRTLCDFARDSNRPQTLMRQIAALLGNGRLPASWLTTKEFRAVWSSAARSVSEVKGCDEAVFFVVQSVTLLCQMDSEKNWTASTVHDDDFYRNTRQTLISILTVLVSIPRLSKEADGQSNSPKQKSDIITRRVRYIIQAALRGIMGSQRGNISLAKYLLTLAEYFTPTSLKMDHDGSTAQSQLSRLCKTMLSSGKGRAWTQVYEGTLSMMCSVAHCCGRGASLPSHHYVLELSNMLNSLELPGQPFKRVDSAAAFSLAERTNDLRDLAYAETFRASQSGGTTPTSQKSVFSGYRWDKDISEWVIASPAFDRLETVHSPSIDTRRSTAHTQTFTVKSGLTQQSNSILSILGNADDSSEDNSVPSTDTSEDETTFTKCSKGSIRNIDHRLRRRGRDGMSSGLQTTAQARNLALGQENRKPSQIAKGSGGGKKRHTGDLLRARIPLRTLDGKMNHNESDDELGM